MFYVLPVPLHRSNLDLISQKNPIQEKTKNQSLRITVIVAQLSCSNPLHYFALCKFDSLSFSFLSSCHEKVTEALYMGRIQTRLGVAFVSEFSG